MIDTGSLRTFLAEQAARPIAVGDHDSLIASRLLDSLKVASLIAFLEEQYAVSLDADDITPENLDSISAIVALLQRKGVA